MKRVTNILFSTFIIVLLSSCFEPDEFPETPLIEFKSLRYVDTEGADSLQLSFRFEDGDGNIGLTNDVDDLFFPFHIYSIIVDANDTIVTINDTSRELPFFAVPVFIATQDGATFPVQAGPSELFSETDNRTSFNCDDYEIAGPDTIFVKRNELYHNFHIEFRKKTGGDYSTIDFAEIFQSDDCDVGNFNGRIPWYDPNGREGIITYSILSQLFRLSFLDDTIQIRFWLYDRDENRSNVEVSPDFVLRDLI